MVRRIIILTEGHTNPHTAKTACCVIRYRPDEVVAVFDGTKRGHTAQDLLGVGPEVPVVGSLDEAPPADTLLIGIAPPGGKVPGQWRPIVLDALARGMNVVSGLHDFLSEDEQFAAAAAEHGATIVDLRKNDEKSIAQRKNIRPDCLRVHTVGHDCSVGKMVVAFEVARGLARAGLDAKFVATGQTGIVVEGDGCPIDRVVADFVSGAAERLVLDNQHHDVLLIEGQGSLFHPAYSTVTLGLLHGCVPQAMILCYEAGRTAVAGMEHVPLAPLAEVRRIYETMAAVMHPSRVIGIAVNGRNLTDEAVRAECDRVSAELKLPAADVFRHGPAKLVDAVLQFRQELLGSR